MSCPSPFLLSSPAPASRQPFTTAAFLPLYSLYYVLAVLAILSHAFIPKLSLLPIFLWQVWKCTTELDFSARLADSLRLEIAARLRAFKFGFVARFYGRATPSLSTDDHYAGWVVKYGVEVRLLDAR
jgi:hypothetical protein